MYSGVNLAGVILGLVVGSIFLGRLFYQLKSGKLLTKWGKTFTTRGERPRLYWSVLSMEAVLVLMVFYFVIHDLRATRR